MYKRQVLTYLVPVDKRIIIFQSSNGRNYTGNPRYIYEEMVRQLSLIHILKDQTDYKKRMGEFGELDKQSIYLEAIPYQHVFYRNCDEPAEGGVIPYVNSETGRFALFFATKQQQLRNTIRGRVMKLRLHNSLVKMTLKFKKQKSAKMCIRDR